MTFVASFYLTMKSESHSLKTGLAGMLISIGIVFGDIGTSPLYVIKANSHGQDDQRRVGTWWT